MIKCKTCRDCDVNKPVADFHRDSNKPDGFRANCKACRSAYMAGRYTENREDILRRQKEKPRDPELLDAYQRRYRRENVEKIAEKNRRWAEANADHKREYNSQYFAQNGEALKAANKKWRQENHEQILSYNREREALKRSLLVDRGVTTNALRDRDGDACTYCGADLWFGRSSNYRPNKASVDHVIPIVRGGEHSFANTVLACLRCNIQKGDRALDEWEALRQRDAKSIHSSPQRVDA